MSKYILPTYTGKLFDLESPTEDMICIEDIAHHLSLENRYNGATKFPYSVAQHSVLVSSIAPKHLKLEALLHDAEETWYKDFPSPLKKLINCRANLIITDSLLPVQELLISEFKLSDNPNDWQIIKSIDLRMATTEIWQLLNTFPTENWQHSSKQYPQYNHVYIHEIEAKVAEKAFILEYNKLKRN